MDSGGLRPSAPPHVPVSVTSLPSADLPPSHPEPDTVGRAHPSTQRHPECQDPSPPPAGQALPHRPSICFSGNHGPKILETLELDSRSGKTGSTTVLPRGPYTLVSKLTLWLCLLSREVSSVLRGHRFPLALTLTSDASSRVTMRPAAHGLLTILTLEESSPALESQHAHTCTLPSSSGPCAGTCAATRFQSMLQMYTR